MTVHGQPLALETRRLRVEGMTCAACVGHVERALRGAQGVASASVNLASESAMVEADGGVTFDDLRTAVEAAGYALREPSDDDAGADETAARALRAQLARAAAAGAAGLFLLLAGFGVLPGIDGLTDQTRFYLMFAVAAPALFLAGGPIYAAAWNAGPPSLRQYEHAHRRGHAVGLRREHRRDVRPRLLRARRPGSHRLLRYRGDHHRPRSTGTLSGSAGTRRDVGGATAAPQPAARYREARRRRRRARGPRERGAPRRHHRRAARRAHTRRRRDYRGRVERRRVDADRREHSRGQGTRRPGSTPGRSTPRGASPSGPSR